MTLEKINQLKLVSNNVRKNIIKLGLSTGRGGSHQGGALSIVELLVFLYCYKFKESDLDFLNDQRSRFILSKGHGALALYSVLNEVKVISKEDLHSYHKNGGDFPGQPSKNIKKGIETSTGSLGMGMPYAVGLALGYKKKNIKEKVYVLIGDGEANEGVIWESLMFAKHQNLNNLVVIIDNNGMQSDGKSDEVINVDLESAFRGFKVDVVKCDGHSFDELDNAFMFNSENELPRIIIADTVKGKGISFMENAKEWHHNIITDELYQKAILELDNNESHQN